MDTWQTISNDVVAPDPLPSFLSSYRAAEIAWRNSEIYKKILADQEVSIEMTYKEAFLAGMRWEAELWKTPGFPERVLDAILVLAGKR